MPQQPHGPGRDGVGGDVADGPQVVVAAVIEVNVADAELCDQVGQDE